MDNEEYDERMSMRLWHDIDKADNLLDFSS
jgi:hypothetical protein